jgi:uncharacterized membrane protein YeaQ/YmgE (transglycosylase-associated protein family)
VLILAIIVLGMAAGALAQLILRSNRRVDWAQALVVGLIGSFVGGLLGSLLAGDGLRLRPSGIIGTIVGAIVVEAIWLAIRSRQSLPQRGRQTTGRTTAKKR